MEEIMMDVITIEDKEFFRVDTINEYNYFAEIQNPKNIYVLKSKLENGEFTLVSLEDDEIDEALMMYTEKNK